MFNHSIPIKKLKCKDHYRLFRVAREFCTVESIKDTYFNYVTCEITFMKRENRDKVYRELKKYKN